MKVGGGLNYVEGPMGAGKTLNGVRRIIAAVGTGRYALTNITLRDGWHHVAARHVAPFSSKQRRRVIAERMLRLYRYETSIEELRRYKVPGTGEARAIVAWDESHNDLNNRKWKDDGRAEILEWATQLRKLGFVGFLFTQHGDNTDAALRRVCNFRIVLQNQREQTRLLGMRVTPWPLFICAWYPANLALGKGGRVMPAKLERYFLSWHRKIYDTLELYHGVAELHEQDDAIILPTLAEVTAVARAAARLPRTSPSITRPAPTPDMSGGLVGEVDQALAVPTFGPERERPASQPQAVSVLNASGGTRGASPRS